MSRVVWAWCFQGVGAITPEDSADGLVSRSFQGRG